MRSQPQSEQSEQHNIDIPEQSYQPSHRDQPIPIPPPKYTV
ncbi:MAG TPA: hypothetical protein VIY08_01020 [Candidatus Nitrosocosmicus sp.]